MKLIAGLGNPGPDYAKTRHNVGFMVVDRLADRLAHGAMWRSKFQAAMTDARIGDNSCLLIKPLTYMNRSGQSVAEVLRFYRVELNDLLVVVDDVALPLGEIRLRAEGSDGGHNGLADVALKLGSDQYPRLRVGIGAPAHAGAGTTGHVLGRFSSEESATIAEAVDLAADAAESWARNGIETAMNRYNKRRPGPSPPPPAPPTRNPPSSPPPSPRES